SRAIRRSTRKVPTRAQATATTTARSWISSSADTRMPPVPRPTRQGPLPQVLRTGPRDAPPPRSVPGSPASGLQRPKRTVHSVGAGTHGPEDRDGVPVGGPAVLGRQDGQVL